MNLENGHTTHPDAQWYPDATPFVRFSAYDFRGRYADTCGFFRDELGI